MCPQKIIPGTSEVYWSNPHTGDLVIDLSEYPELDDTIKKEDVFVIGNWQDYTGSGTANPQDVMMQGIADGIKTPAQNLTGDETNLNLTDKGNNASTHRQRNKLVYIENG